MAIVWDKALFDLAYESNAEPDGHPNTRPAIRLHYNRYVIFPGLVRRVQQLIEILGLTESDRILLIGAGFGWTAEVFNGMGYTAAGTDTSPYIQSAKDTTEDSEVDAALRATGLDPGSNGMTHYNRLRNGGTRARATVLDEDSMSRQSRGRVTRALWEPTIVITEDLVTSLTDTEAVALHAELVQYGARVVHFLTENANPNPPFEFNSKSLAGWKLIFPSSTVIANGYTLRVL
jgi:hypothetical protein